MNILAFKRHFQLSYGPRDTSNYFPVPSNAQVLTVTDIAGRLQGGKSAPIAGTVSDRESPGETLNLREVVYTSCGPKDGASKN
jgi:hypothetical protein